MSLQSLINPENLNSVAGLELIARTIIDGYLAGLNQSARTGTGQEFSQYRSYQPGDDLRLLDWKMYGRSDRYYIREAEVETNIDVRFIIDASASMQHQDNGITKLQYARLLAATLAYLALKQGDAIGLISFNENDLYRISERQGKQHYRRFLYELIRLEGVGKWPSKSTVAQLSKGKHREMLIFISDFYEQHNEITQTLKTCKTKNNEVLALHLMGENEINLNFGSISVFEDLETGEVVQADMAATDYSERLQAYLGEMRRNMLSMLISYELFTMDQKIHSALPLFLKRRLQLL